ncbi:MAG: lipid-A-disaccharide synthase [Paramuribaculum sp.]|nr:lipid-A-disaccharide synthase [Paramuribaculum sp.]
MHYFISAGEASGDLHAGELMNRLREADPNAHFTFTGGDNMSCAAGHEPLVHIRDMAFMGFSEVIRNLGRIRNNFTTVKKAIDKLQPDCVILVDYPSFNLKIARHARKLGIPVVYYIAPKVWAWKEWRVKQIRRNVNLILSILPFEPEYFARKGITAHYVGNPSVEEVDRKLATAPTATEFRTSHHLTDTPILALVPGSRVSEIRNNLPIMHEVARRFANRFQAVIAGAPDIDLTFYRQFSDLPVVTDATYLLMKHSQAALVTSGTATLECALCNTPQIVCYRGNGSKLTYKIMERLLHIPFVSLPNLIAGKEIVPELLMYRCNADSVSYALTDILPDTIGRQKQLEGYTLMRSRLGKPGAAKRAAHLILNLLSK